MVDINHCEPPLGLRHRPNPPFTRWCSRRLGGVTNFCMGVRRETLLLWILRTPTTTRLGRCSWPRVEKVDPPTRAASARCTWRDGGFTEIPAGMKTVVAGGLAHTQRARIVNGASALNRSAGFCPGVGGAFSPAAKRRLVRSGATNGVDHTGLEPMTSRV